MTRRRRQGPASAAPSAFGYVRDADTPVSFTDVVAALRSLADVAAGAQDREIVEAARRVEVLVDSLRSQFVDDVVGLRLPSQTAIAVDRVRSRGSALGDQFAGTDDAVTRLRPPSSRAASNS